MWIRIRITIDQCRRLLPPSCTTDTFPRLLRLSYITLLITCIRDTFPRLRRRMAYISLPITNIRDIFRPLRLLVDRTRD